MINRKDRLFIPSHPTPQEKEFPEILREVAKRAGMRGKAVSGNFQFTRTLLLVLPCGNQKIILDFPHIQKKGQL